MLPTLFSRRVFSTICGVALAGFAACGPKVTTPINAQTLTVACGSCVFEMEEAQGCPWAAEVDGKYYLMRGAVPQDHDTHAPDGMCNMPRKAVVTGELRDDLLFVSAMELKPAAEIPEKPKYTAADQH